MSNENTPATDLDSNNTDDVNPTWGAKSAVMEKRYKATEDKHGLNRCAKNQYLKMPAEEIQKIHADAVRESWPNTVIALCRFGCSDNQVSTIFQKAGLEPLNVRGSSKQIELSSYEYIKRIDVELGELRAKRLQYVEKARMEFGAEEDALAEKRALLDAVVE